MRVNCTDVPRLHRRHTDATKKAACLKARQIATVNSVKANEASSGSTRQGGMTNAVECLNGRGPVIQAPSLLSCDPTLAICAPFRKPATTKAPRRWLQRSSIAQSSSSNYERQGWRGGSPPCQEGCVSSTSTVAGGPWVIGVRAQFWLLAVVPCVCSNILEISQIQWGAQPRGGACCRHQTCQPASRPAGTQPPALRRQVCAGSLAAPRRETPNRHHPHFAQAST